MHSHLYRMKWCELQEYKWNEDMTITVESQFKPLQNSPVRWPIYWVHQPMKWMKHRMKWILNCRDTNEVKTWPSQLNSNLSNCEVAREKDLQGFKGDSNPWPLHSCCSALPAELLRPIPSELDNLLRSSTREMNETKSEMMWTAWIQMK